jgi:prolyl-tRNA synthetase
VGAGTTAHSFSSLPWSRTRAKRERQTNPTAAPPPITFGAVTRLNGYFLPTERQPPSDAEALSHKLGVRAGLVRQVGAGLWSWLPAGWRVHRNVEQIIREELDRIGCQEMLMSVITPAELWKRSGRYGFDEVFKLNDRRGADLVLALSHEETVTFHVAQAVRSYRELPMLLYHFQTKGRDEPRPRAGVLRTREFIMKDAYSFDRDAEGLQASYGKFVEAYDAIFDRVGLEWYRVESDVGLMGGWGAHEYMAPCPAGENDVALAPGYAANTEIASAEAQPVPPLASGIDGDLHTPDATTVAAVASALEVGAGNVLKAFPVITESRGLVMAFVRGDHRVNEIKLANALKEGFRPAREEELPGPAGFLGPTPDVPSLYDEALVPGQTYVTGANRPDYHRVVSIDGGDRGDLRTVEAGDTVNGHPIRIEPAIEVGNIFKLGTRYSEPLGATYLDENGTEQLIVMGSYGIGPARVAAAAIEQYADEQGISWPRSIAPWDVEIVAIGKPDTPEREAAEQLYAELSEAGLDVLLDDRDAGPGEKFADAELLGVPLRLTVGKRSLESGRAEAQARRGRADHEGGVPLRDAAEAVRELWKSLP